MSKYHEQSIKFFRLRTIPKKKQGKAPINSKILTAPQIQQ